MLPITPPVEIVEVKEEPVVYVKGCDGKMEFFGSEEGARKSGGWVVKDVVKDGRWIVLKCEV